MKKLGFIFLFITFIVSLNAQVRGRVSEKQNDNPLMGAHVVLFAENGITVLAQTISDRDGEFSLEYTIQAGMKIHVSYIGFEIFEQNLTGEEFGKNLEISMTASRVPVGEVMVSALRQDKHLKDVSMPVSVVDATDIENTGGFTPTDMLRNEPGLSLARDGIWATSLNIRGLTEQRIITLVDGNRVETATDIAAGMAMVDVNDIERIEVIKGAASSVYGTGALGGVVNIITKDGHYSNKLSVEGSAGLSWQSVNSMHSEHASVQLGDEKWYFRLSGTYRDAANTQTPEGELENSQFTDNNISIKAGVKTFNNQELRINLQRYQAEDVGIPGGKSFPSAAKASYPEERRNLAGLEYKIKGKGEIFRELSLKYFHQYILRDVELIPNANSTVTPSGYHTTNGGLLQLNLQPAKGHSLITGLDIWQRNLRTERFKDVYMPIKDEAGNVISTNHIFKAEIPIPETDFTSAGLFLQDEFKMLNERLKIDIGGRFDFINVQNEEAVDPLYIIMNEVRNDNPSNQRITFEENNVNNVSWSANLGLLYKLTNDLNITAGLSRAFRSPSIEERYKYIDLGSTVSIGDPDLKPEDGYFADLGIKLWKDNFHFSLNGFVNSMSNLIVAEPGEIEYSYLDQPDRTDTVPALINANVDQAVLYGYDLSLSYNFYDGLVLFGSSSFVRGKDTKNDADLPLIPPLNARLGIRYTTDSGYGLEAVSNLMADQDKIAEGETETKGYASYDLRFYTKKLDLNFMKLKFYAGVENLFDRAYVNHLSTNRGYIKYEPGRNLYVRLRIDL